MLHLKSIILFVIANCFWKSGFTQPLSSEKSFRKKLALDKGKGDGSYNNLSRFKDILSSRVNKIEESMRKLEKSLEYRNDGYQEQDSNNPDTFWSQTDKCVETISSKSGNIFGRALNTTESERLSQRQSCQWVIQASRSFVKLTLRRPHRFKKYSYYSNDEVTDKTTETLSHCNATVPVFNRTEIMVGVTTLNTTRMTPGHTHVFQGSLVIILECVVSYLTVDELDFIEFENFGPKAPNDINFNNYFLLNDSGNMKLIMLNENDILKPFAIGIFTWPGCPITNRSDIAKNLELKEIQGFDNHAFCKTSFLSVHISNGPSGFIDCCKVKCSDYKFIISENYIRVIYGIATSNPIIQNSNATVNWEQREWGGKTDYGFCGGVFSGWAFGTMAIAESSDPNLRCVLAFHPFPNSEMLLKIGANLEIGHDHLTAVEIDDDDSVRTTRLPLLEWKYLDLTLRGRLILLILVTDNSVATGRIDMKWNVVQLQNQSNSIFTQDDHIHRYRFNSTEGNITWASTGYQRHGKHFFIINPSSLGPRVLDLKVSFELSGLSSLSVLRSRNGIFEKISHANKTLGYLVQNFTSWDGIFVLIADIKDTTAEIKFSAYWNPGHSIFPNHYENCGGTIVGEQRAWISYKPGTKYDYNERCTWMIYAPYENVTFKMVKERLDNYDGVIIETLDMNSGQLLTNSHFMDTENTTATFPGPVLLVTFTTNSYDDHAYRQPRGFVLEMEGVGESFTIEDIRLLHLNDTDQTYSYFQNLENGQRPEQLTVFAYNHGVTGIKRSKLTSNFYTHLHSPFEEGYKFSLFSYSDETPLSNSSAFETLVTCSFVFGKVEDECVFENERTTGLNESEWLSSHSEHFHAILPFSGFVGTVKPLTPPSPSSRRLSYNSSVPRFRMDWEKANHCGGRVDATSGTICYKEGEYLDTDEHCVWVVSAPGKTSLTFELSNSYYTNYYSGLSIVPVYLDTHGEGRGLGDRSVFGNYYYNRDPISLDTPIAIVTLILSSGYRGFCLAFTSDSGDEGSIHSRWETRFLRTSKNYTVPKAKAQTMGRSQGAVVVVSPVASSTSEITNLTIQDLHLFLDENCTSDYLYFYGWDKSYSYDLVKAYRVYRDDEIAEVCLNETQLSLSSTPFPDAVDFEDEENPNLEPSHNTTKAFECALECFQKNVKLDHESQFQIQAPFIIIYKSVSEAKLKEKLSFHWITHESITSEYDPAYDEDNIDDY